ncbi:hypothetical protein, partial [Endozoicomonas sp.]|uniref:hypothetical protein n=1 Tax=Endozoicomonas sp. TaxID=1892382 RepID=UPI00383B56ED
VFKCYQNECSSVTGICTRLIRRSFDSPLEMEAIEKRLKSYCISKEITPLPKIDKELELGVSFLSYYFPELTRELVQENQKVRRSESEIRYERFTCEISKIIIDLEREGIVPSYNQVRSRLTGYHGFHYRDFTRLWVKRLKSGKPAEKTSASCVLLFIPVI